MSATARSAMDVTTQKPRSAEMFPEPALRIGFEINRLERGFMQKFAEFQSPDVSDLLNRMYAVDQAIIRLTCSHHRLCGPACTVKVFPGDNLMVHKVLDVAKPGDIVVVDAHGSSMNAVLGDLISTKAKHRGIAGFVVDGYVRDLPDLIELDFPVFARGATPIGPLHRGPGEINFPICCGGIVVNPADLVAADGAGVVVIPQEVASELLERLQAQRANMAAYLAGVQCRQVSNDWVDRVLEEAGCIVRGNDQRS